MYGDTAGILAKSNQLSSAGSVQECCESSSQNALVRFVQFHLSERHCGHCIGLIDALLCEDATESTGHANR